MIREAYLPFQCLTCLRSARLTAIFVITHTSSTGFLLQCTGAYTYNLVPVLEVYHTTLYSEYFEDSSGQLAS